MHQVPLDFREGPHPLISGLDTRQEFYYFIVTRFSFLLDHLRLRVGDLPLCVLRVLLAGADARHEEGEGALRDCGGSGTRAHYLINKFVFT